MLGLLESLVMKVLKKWFRRNISYHEANTSNQQNAINMCYMNVQKERESDSKNFGARITGFGVVVEKIWSFEVSGGYFINFSKAREHSRIIFQILGALCQTMDCGSISKKPRGLFAKFPKQPISGFILELKNSWTGSTGHGPAAHPGPRWNGAARAQRQRGRMAVTQRGGRGGSPAGWVRESRAT
jgi:hypothetical protein